MSEDEPFSDVLKRIYERSGNVAARDLIEKFEAVERHEAQLKRQAERSDWDKVVGEITVIEQCLRDENPSPPVEAYLLGRLRELEGEL